MKNIFDSQRWKQFFARHSKTLIFGLLVIAFGFGFFFHWIFTPATKSLPTEKETVAYEVSEEPTIWTCSMHPNIKMAKPGKCPICGMNLIPVKSLTGHKDMGGMRRLTISQEVRALMNIQTIPAERRYASTEVRMVGKVAYDETRLAYIAAWVPGRLDRLYVDYTGVEVKKGDHMVYIYSPDLYATQDELIQALKSSQARKAETSLFPDVVDLVQSARERLRLWGISNKEILEIEKSGKPSDHMTIYAPIGGIVTMKMRQEGDYVNVGERIYAISDLSELWVMLDAYESDLVWLRYGQKITFTTEAYPSEKFIGQIAFIEPILNDKTRTVKVRVNVPNPTGKLKPDMFVHGIVQAQIAADGRVIDPDLVGKWICPFHPSVTEDKPGTCNICGMTLVTAESLGYVSAEPAAKSIPLVIPVAAALVTGTRAVVYVEIPGTEQPTFEGREIVLGPRAGNYYLVRSGLKEGELVVTYGNFNIDSALQIQAKPSMMTPEGGGGGGMHHHGTEATPPKAGQPEAGIQMNIPAEFYGQLQKLEVAFEVVSNAVELKDLNLIRTAFQTFDNILNEVDAKLLIGHPQMLWNEYFMLLNNDVVEGKEVKLLKEADRVCQLLKEHMRRMREQFGTSHLGRKSHPSLHPEVLAEIQTQLAKFWEAYLSLHGALASDNFNLASQSITHLQTPLLKVDARLLHEETQQIWEKQFSDLIMAIQSMNQAEDLKALRENFASLSEKVLVLIKTFVPGGFGTVYQLHCPMAIDSRGAIWLQNDDQVKNPYLGSAMLQCADRVEQISGDIPKEQSRVHHHE